MLTKAKLLRMPAKKYMAKEQLEFFQTQLTDQKTEALKEIEDARNTLPALTIIELLFLGLTKPIFILI